MDLGAGTNFNTLDFFLTAGKGIIVCTPEPTSIENAFRFIKAVYLRKLKQLIKQHPFDPAVKTRVLDKASSGQSSQSIIDTVLKHDPENEAFLIEHIGKFQFKMILNQYRKNADPTLGDKIKVVCNRHFYSPFEILGRVEFDERVIDTIYARKLYVQEYPDTVTTMGLKHIAGLLVHGQKGPSENAP